MRKRLAYSYTPLIFSNTGISSELNLDLLGTFYAIQSAAISRLKISVNKQKKAAS
jgi:hypothetical protein